MNSTTDRSTYQPDASGLAPKQLEYIPNLKLNDGNEIPMVAFGLGTANVGKGHEEITKLATLAIQSGYKHLDGAQFYRNEEALGAAIKASGVAREKLFVTTKFHDLQGGTVQAALKTSLDKLGLDYVDLYLVHFPSVVEGNKALQDVWAQMEALKESGQARSIGVSNFLQEHLEAVLETAKILPAVNQIEYHPYLQHLDLPEFHRKHNIAIAAYGPLTSVVHAKPGPLDATWAELAKKYGVTENDIALRWCLDQGIIVVTTSANEHRLQGYIRKLPSFKLTPKEVQTIAELGRQKHFRRFGNGTRYKEDDRR